MGCLAKVFILGYIMTEGKRVYIALKSDHTYTVLCVSDPLF